MAGERRLRNQTELGLHPGWATCEACGLGELLTRTPSPAPPPASASSSTDRCAGTDLRELLCGSPAHMLTQSGRGRLRVAEFPVRLGWKNSQACWLALLCPEWAVAGFSASLSALLGGTSRFPQTVSTPDVPVTQESSLPESVPQSEEVAPRRLPSQPLVPAGYLRSFTPRHVGTPLA